jgi:DNA polymerase III subunit alpha
VPDAVLVVKARVDHKEGESKLIALEVTAYEGTPERSEVRLKIDTRVASRGTLRDLASVLRDFPGDLRVVADLIKSDGTVVFEFGPDFRVKPEPDFFAEVKALLGEAAVA